MMYFGQVHYTIRPKYEKYPNITVEYFRFNVTNLSNIINYCTDIRIFFPSMSISLYSTPSNLSSVMTTFFTLT